MATLRYTKAIIGIGYNPKIGEKVPYLTLTQKGESVSKILKLAKKHNIPVIPNTPLCNALIDMKLGSLIPVKLFRTVAIVLSKLEKL